MTKDYPFDEGDARQFYRWLRHEPGEFTEVRVIEWIHPDVKDNAGKSVQGIPTQFFVTNEEDFVRFCREWNGKRQVYAGINPRCRKSGKAEDVKRITGFPFDIDAPTPNKRAQAANDTEVKCAEGYKTDLVDLATQQFGIEPYVDFSGNGHRVCLPCNITVTNEADIDAKLKLFFAEYKQKLCLPDFDNISDLPRIIKVPGTWSLKGNHTEHRPHRQAKLIQLGNVSEEKIKEVSDYILSLNAQEKNKPTPTQQSSSQPIEGLDPLKIVKLRTCFLDFINNPQRHRVCVDLSKDSRNTETGLRKALVLEMFFAGFNKEDTLMVCQKFDDYNKEKSSDEIDRELDNLDPKYKNWTCKSIHENGGCLGEPCQNFKRKVMGQEPEENPEQKNSEFENKLAEFAVKPDLQKTIIDEIELTVKNDRPIKTSLFYAGLSAYTTPINVSIKGESGLGKTYNATETMKYFPQNDILYLGGLSPKAIIHENGILLDKDGNPIKTEENPVNPSREGKKAEDYIKEKAAYDEKLKKYMVKMRGAYTLIDLTNKIILFLEAPSYETFEMLKPILSHDKPEIHYKFVDKTGKGQMTTKHVVIRGAPATICLSVEKKYMSEYATRTFTATPEASKEKIKAANELTNDKNSYPWKYDIETVTARLIKALIIQIKKLLLEKKIQVVNPFVNLSEIFPKDLVRDMRDFQHFNQFLKAFTILHIYQRPILEINGKRYAVTSAQDVINAFRVFDAIFETTRTGTDKRILEFYRENVKQKSLGINIKKATESYNKTAATKNEKLLSSFTIRRWFERLEEIAYVDKQDDPVNKSRNIYIPLITEEKQENRFADLCKSENQMILAANLEKGFEKWFTGELQCCIHQYTNETTNNSVIALNEAQIKTIILTYDDEFYNTLNKAKTDLEATNKAKELCKTEMQSPAKPENNSYTQKNYSLKIKPTKNAEKCWSCESQASTREVQQFMNDVLEVTFFNCDCCLREKTIPSFKDQGAEIDIAAPEPPEEAS